MALNSKLVLILITEEQVQTCTTGKILYRSYLYKGIFFKKMYFC